MDARSWPNSCLFNASHEQILVGDASAEFPKLRHAFFVRDILIKRDCKYLQRLASDVFIVNIYGTTETQRAVSYYEIPCKSQDPEYFEKWATSSLLNKGNSVVLFPDLSLKYLC